MKWSFPRIPRDCVIYQSTAPEGQVPRAEFVTLNVSQIADLG